MLSIYINEVKKRENVVYAFINSFTKMNLKVYNENCLKISLNDLSDNIFNIKLKNVKR